MVDIKEWIKLKEFARVNKITVGKDINKSYYFLFSFNNRNYVYSEREVFLKDIKETKYTPILKDFRFFKDTYNRYKLNNVINNISDKILTKYFGMKNNKFIFDKRFFTFNKNKKTIKEEGEIGNYKITDFILNEINKELKDDNKVGKFEILSYFQDLLKYEGDNRNEYPDVDANHIKIIDNFFNKHIEKSMLNNKFIPILVNSLNEIYIENLMSKNGNKARQYLNNRGITNDEIKSLGLGLGDNFFKFSKNFEKSLQKKLAEKLGDDLDIYNEWIKYFDKNSPLHELGFINYLTNGDSYDAMTNRITIPIKDKDGNIIAFGGRKYFEDNRDTPKYLMNKNSIIWKKSWNLFGLDLCKNNINKNNVKIINLDQEKKNPVMIVEGFMDAFALNKIGIPAVALMGVSISDEQINLLKEECKDSIFFVSLDFDNAGRLNNSNISREIEERLGDKDNNKFVSFSLSKPMNMKCKDFDEYINQSLDNKTNEERKNELREHMQNDYFNFYSLLALTDIENEEELENVSR